MTFRSVNDMKGQRTAMQFICEEQGREFPKTSNHYKRHTWIMSPSTRNNTPKNRTIAGAANGELN